MDKEYYVYILASEKYGTLYTGITNDPIRRTCEHRENMISGFTKNMAYTARLWPFKPLWQADPAGISCPAAELCYGHASILSHQNSEAARFPD